MIQSVWKKQIAVIVQMDQQDVADHHQSLPLILSLSWNHYIGFYYQKIIQFFMSNLPFPIKDQQFWLQIPSQNIILDGTQIISHLVNIYDLKIQKQPLKLVCHFRNNILLPQLNLKKHYKNNLKASTAIRYGKYGASRLTVQMSIQNIDDMYTNFNQNKRQKYLGSSCFEDDDLGYQFLIADGQHIPIRIINKDFILERSCPKDYQVQDFFQELLSKQIYEKIPIKLHTIPVNNYRGKISELQKYCHPDGFLYFYI